VNDLRAPADDVIFAMQGLVVAYGGVPVINQLSFSVAAGQSVGLIGPNGAGKSTVVGALGGMVRPRSGHMMLAGRDLGKVSPRARVKLGMSRTFQNLEIFSSLTAVENVACAIYGRSIARRIDRRRVREEAVEALRSVGIDKYANVQAALLPYGIRKLLELARCFVSSPRFVVLDEPVAGLSVDEKQVIVNTIVSYCADSGAALLLIEHDMGVVQELCTEIIAIDAGEEIAHGAAGEVLNDPRVIDAYLGTAIP